MPNRLSLIVLILALAGCAANPQAAPATAQQARGPLFERGMVSAADPRAASAGAEILRRGGNATDAAIATMVALTVVEPQSSGIGGGGFYVRAAPGGTITTLDGRETAPAAATPQRFLDATGKPLPFRTAVVSGLSVGVPGNLALAAEAHRQFGKLSWRELFQPAIRLAREGWALSERGREFLVQRPDSAAHDPAALALFYSADGEPVPVGTMLRNPALAGTLEQIAAQGPDAFYASELADRIAADVAGQTPADGKLTATDLAAYRALEREPVCGHYRLYRICGMGPPSSGATTVIAILGQLEKFDLAALGPGSPLAWHLFAESQRLAYADRERFLADPDFVAVPVRQLTDPAYLARRGTLISPDRSLAEVAPGLAAAPPDGHEPEEHGTSHFVVIDQSGDTVSYTSTIESAFGSGIMVGGFYLNNELTDFSFIPEQDGAAVANRVEGGKRPRSSMAPTVVYGPDGRLVLALGAAGGGTIPVQVARVLIGTIDWKLPLGEALALPMLYSPGETLIVEQGSELEAMIPQLKALGHDRVMLRELPIKTNAIAISGDVLVGAADPRSEGEAIAQ